MMLLEMFRDGGWGMIPTLVFGLVLLGVSAKFARAPERRTVPLLIALNWITLVSGGLGFVSGVIVSCRALAGEGLVDPGRIASEALAETLQNVAFALLFAMVAAVMATVGAWRLSRGRMPEGAV
jgi:hypothetical protein